MTMTFVDRDGEVFAEGPAPEEMMFSGALLREADPRWLDVRDGMVDIHVMNGRWVYEIVEEREGDTVVGVLRYSEGGPS